MCYFFDVLFHCCEVVGVIGDDMDLTLRVEDAVKFGEEV